MTATGSLSNAVTDPRVAGPDVPRLYGREHAARMQAKNDRRPDGPRPENDVIVTLGEPPAEPVTYTARAGSPSVTDEPLQPRTANSPAPTAPLIASGPADFSSIPFDPNAALPTPISVNNPTVTGQGEFDLDSEVIDNSQFGLTLGQGAAITTTWQSEAPASNDTVLVEDNGRLAIDTRIINNARSEIILGEGAKVTYNYIMGPDNGQDTTRVADNGSLTIDARYVNNSRNLMIIGDGAEVTFNFWLNPDNADDSITVKDSGNLAIDLHYVDNRTTVFEVGANAKVTINSEVDLDNAADTITVADHGSLSLKSSYVDNRDSLYRFGAGQEITLNGHGVYDNVESSLMVAGQDRVTIATRFRDRADLALGFDPTAAVTDKPTSVGGSRDQSDTKPSTRATVSENAAIADSVPTTRTSALAGQGLNGAASSATAPGEPAVSARDILSSLFNNRYRKDLAYLTASTNSPQNPGPHGPGKAPKTWDPTVQAKNRGRFSIEI